jgi:DnaK suppressor protein
MAISTHTLSHPSAAAVNETTEELRRMLSGQRRELINDIHERMKEARADASANRRPIDSGDTTEVEPVDDLGFILLQMKAHELNKIDLAVQRLDEGSYGRCIDCVSAIAPSRLRAMPFAIRCKDCEERRERSSQPRATGSLRYQGVGDTYVQ